MVIQELSYKNFEQFYQCFSELMLEGYGHFPEKLRDYFLKFDYSRNNFAFWMEKAIRKVYLAYESNELRGFLVGDATYGGIGFISWLGVLPKFRSKGIGKALLAEYEKFARGKNAHLLELFTFDNTKGYYEKLGFKEVGRREQGYYGQQNVIMNKVLGEYYPIY